MYKIKIKSLAYNVFCKVYIACYMQRKERVTVSDTIGATLE